MNKPPAEQAPPVLLDLDFTQEANGEGLLLVSPGPGNVTGQPFGAQMFRDAVVDVELGLLEGEEEDRYGVFFRQSAAERYAAVTLSAGGELAVGLVDGGPPLVIAGGPLPAEVAFARGAGGANRLTIVSCGPVAAVIVNGSVVVGAAIPAIYGHGAVGALLIHTSSSATARAGVRWAQARALLPDQAPV